MDANYAQFRDEILGLARKNGAIAELYSVSGESFRAQVLDAELENYHVANTMGVSLRVKFGGKTGYAYTEALSGEEELFAKALENARLIETDEEEPFAHGGLEYAEVCGYSARIHEIDERAKIALALDLEQKTKVADERVERVRSCSLSTGIGETRIENTLGLSVSFKSSHALAYVTPVVGQGDAARDGFAFRLGKHAGELDFETLSREAVGDALDKLGAGRYPSGRVPLVLRADAAAALLGAFAPVFSAYEAQKGLSLLNGREGEKIGGDIITLIDDPHLSGGYASAPFDAEGTPTAPLAVIENGVLKTLLHNLRTAKKADTVSTGHAGKASVAAPVGVSPTNFHIKPDVYGLGYLIKEMGNGLLVTDVSGLHAGVNPVSGDFSLLARGFAIENGIKTRPVELVTVAGNFFELLKAVKAVGSDLFFGLPGNGCAGSPSLLIEGLMIAGD